MKVRFIITACLCFISVQLPAQDTKIKFGKVDPQDFKQNTADSNVHAIVIADIGSSHFEGNSKGWFSLVHKRFKRMQIITKNGYDAANVEISIYTDGKSEEDLTSLKAVTYNLENGKVVETKLETKSAVFKDKINKKLLIKKFTFPNIREGSIIEFKYEITSDFLFNLQPWEFQGEFPTRWSEYTVSIPQFFDYNFLSQGYQSFHLNEKKNYTSSFNISEAGGVGATERYNFNSGVTDYRWAIKDAPALKNESFTSTVRNHITKMQFQLAGYKDPLKPRSFLTSWPEACVDLLKDEDFGYSLNRDNGWLNDAISATTKNTQDKLQKAKNIFEYVRDNMTCTDHNRLYIDHPLKNVLKDRSGSEAEINLLLTAMFIKAGYTADPVMLSTRSHGYVYTPTPILERFNYIITRVKIDDNYYFLDASVPEMGFGKLGFGCYNGNAKIINPEEAFVELKADELVERKLSSVVIINDDKGNMSGAMRQTPGYYESTWFRSRIKEKGKDQFFSDIKKAFNTEVEISNTAIDSVKNYDVPLFISYDFDIKQEKEDIIYFNPMFGEGWKENPFKSDSRAYPIEMPYARDETYLLKMDVPEGYVVDELPKQLKIRLNETEDSFFEYLITESEGVISLRTRLQLKRALYLPDEYETLREFFNMIVKKQSEQIVFKKKK